MFSLLASLGNLAKAEGMAALMECLEKCWASLPRWGVRSSLRDLLKLSGVRRFPEENWKTGEFLFPPE